MNFSDSIVALSSATGAAARMIVRVSGPIAPRMAREVTSAPADPQPSATFTRLRFAGLVVPAWLYVFRAPRSYTCEDLVEFHLPGNPVLARLLLNHLRGSGARDAQPGEFTARAFFNGRLDLAEAEGVAATIGASNENELAAARQLMAGELSRRVRPVLDHVAHTLALVEAGIDFTDEDVTFLGGDALRSRVAEADALLDRLLNDSARFDRVSHQVTVVLVGRPNAGKSTLLNALAGRHRAVVSAVAGTTRDVLSAEVALDRGIVRLIDVAGLDDSDAAPGESIVSQMREAARRAAAEADLVVLARDVTDARPPVDVGRPPALEVLTKADLLERLPQKPADGTVAVSAATGWNLEALRERLSVLAFERPNASATLSLNARHVAAVREGREALARAADRASGPSPEVVALELREALDALGTIVGMITPDDLLGRVFSTFCIGK